MLLLRWFSSDSGGQETTAGAYGNPAYGNPATDAVKAMELTTSQIDRHISSHPDSHSHRTAD